MSPRAGVSPSRRHDRETRCPARQDPRGSARPRPWRRGARLRAGVPGRSLRPHPGRAAALSLRAPGPGDRLDRYGALRAPGLCCLDFVDQAAQRELVLRVPHLRMKFAVRCGAPGGLSAGAGKALPKKRGRPAGRPRFSATAEISCFRPPSSGPWSRRTRRRHRRERHPWPLGPSCRGRGRWR